MSRNQENDDPKSPGWLAEAQDFFQAEQGEQGRQYAAVLGNAAILYAKIMQAEEGKVLPKWEVDLEGLKKRYSLSDLEIRRKAEELNLM